MKKKRWKPRFGQCYYYIDDCMMIYHSDWFEDDCTNEIRSDVGNCFRTRKEAEVKLKKIKVILKK